MSDDPTDFLIPDVESRGRSVRGHRSWPIITKASLILLGFIPHNANRKCIRCAKRTTASDAIDEDGDGLGERENNSSRNDATSSQNEGIKLSSRRSSYGSINSSSSVCVVCESLNPHPTRLNENIPSRRRRFCHVAMLTIVTTMLSVNLLQHVTTRWGSENLLLYTVSYTTFFGPFVAVAVYRLVATLIPCPPTSSRGIHTMTDTNVLGLLNRVDVSRYVIPGYINLAIVLLYVISISSFHLYHLQNCKEVMPLGIFAYFCELVGVFLFMAFWHIAYVLRMALQNDLKHTSIFLKQHHHDDSVNRRRVMESYLEFYRLDCFFFMWMAFQISIVAFKIFSLVYWDYFLYSRAIKFLDRYESTEARIIDVVMWIEIVILLFFPLVSAGAMNVHYLWEKFYALVEYEQDGPCWPCVKMVRHLVKARDNINVTICGCVFSIFVAFNLGSQHARYWAGGICYNHYNSTTLNNTDLNFMF
ncbi:uncharacterized protein [Ptychodera flava]|uniref:uncharacterized protein n=1 Tax=Ptychodera flava TaxID=63121 RepID=UPI00396A0E25